jgi:hypothetical protein
VIATLRRRWDLGGPLTGRDAGARELSGILALATPRDPADWPELRPQPVPPYGGRILAPEAAMQGFFKAAFDASLALASQRGLNAPRLAGDESITRGDAAAILDDVVRDMFVRLRRS